MSDIDTIEMLSTIGSILQEALERLKTIEPIVKGVKEETGYSFTYEEIVEVLKHTVRKCEINGKGPSYIEILFKNELTDYVTRQSINALSSLNYYT